MADSPGLAALAYNSQDDQCAHSPDYKVNFLAAATWTVTPGKQFSSAELNTINLCSLCIGKLRTSLHDLLNHCHPHIHPASRLHFHREYNPCLNSTCYAQRKKAMTACASKGGRSLSSASLLLWDLITTWRSDCSTFWSFVCVPTVWTPVFLVT